MQRFIRKAGATSQIIPISVFDSSSTTGAKLTGLVYNSASLTAYYNRIGAAGAATAITLVTATKGTWTSSGFIAIDGTNMPGDYELHIPDAAIAAGASGVLIQLKGATNMVPVNVYIDLTVFDLQTATQKVDIETIKTQAVTCSAATTIGVYVGNGTAAINVDATGYVRLQAVQTGTTIPTVTAVTNQLTAGAIATGVWQDTTAGDFTVASSIGKSLYTSGVVPGAAGGVFIAGSNAATTVNITGDITGNLSGSVGSVTGAVGSVTGAVGSVTAGVTVTTNNDKTGYALSAGGVDAIWDEEITVGHTTADTAGKKLNDAGAAGDPWSTALPGAYGAGTAGKIVGDNINAPIATVDTVVDAIKVKTDYLPSVTAGAAGGVFIAGSNAATSVTTALTANITGNLSGSVGSVTGAVGSITAGVTVTTNNDKTGYALSSAGIQAIWDALTSALTTVGSIGKKLADWVVGTIDTYTGNTKQTGDAFARLGAPAGVSVSADIAVIEAQTDDIGVAGAGLTAIPWNIAWDAEVQSECDDAITANAVILDLPTTAEFNARTLAAASYGTAANQTTIIGYIDTEVASILSAVDTEVGAIKAVTDKVDTTLVLDGAVYQFTANALELAPSGSGLDAAGVRAAVGLAAANLDTQLGDIPTVAEFNARSLPSADYTVVSDLGTVQTGDSFAIINGVSGCVAIKGDTAAILEDTGTTLPAQIAAIAGGVGSGPVAHPYTVTTIGAVPCADALVIMSTDSAGVIPIHSGRTNALGVVTFYPDLPVGTTVYLWRYKTGLNFVNPDTEEIHA